MMLEKRKEKTTSESSNKIVYSRVFTNEGGRPQLQGALGVGAPRGHPAVMWESEAAGEDEPTSPRVHQHREQELNLRNRYHRYRVLAVPWDRTERKTNLHYPSSTAFFPFG